jgi:glycosyltransferase involved in cell wall biosynthesis
MGESLKDNFHRLMETEAFLKIMKNRVAFVLYRYPLGVSLMVINSIRMFAQRDINVDVYMDEAVFNESPVKFDQKNIRVFLYSNTGLLIRIISFGASRIRSFVSSFGFLYKLPERVLSVFFIEDLFFSWWLRKRLDGAYDYIIPVECKSLLAVADAGLDIVYYNMELLDWAEENPIYGKDKKFLKMLEYEAVKNIYAVVLQNENRAKRFSEINHYNKRHFILPVAAMGEPVLKKTSLLREKFKIPQSKKIVVYSGNIMPWAKCLEMVDSVRNWPKNFCFVIHTWRSDGFSSEYGKKVREHAQGLPVYFSYDYIDYKDLAGFLSSADIALMFYEAIDENFTEILFSSNKLADYLKAGLPVVTSDFPTLRQFFSENGIGCTVRSMEELPQALKKTSESYDSFRANVFRCYQSKFRFEKFFVPFFEKLYVGAER